VVASETEAQVQLFVHAITTMDLKIPLPKFLTLLTAHDVPIQKAMALSAKMLGHKSFHDNFCVIMLF